MQVKKYTTAELEEKIERNWRPGAIPLYFAQVLSGEISIKDTIDDLLSLDPKVSK